MLIGLLTILAWVNIGTGFTIIVGGSALIAFVAWLLTTYRHPVDGQRVLPLFALAIGMQFIHMTEEFVAGFPDAFSTLTGSRFPPDTFVLVAVLGGGTVYALAGYGLTRRNPVANYLLWFFLIGPAGLVNTVAHLALPVLNGTLYFPGLLTVLLPTVAGTTLAWRIVSDSRAVAKLSAFQ
jgi:hypothetical protein